MTNLKNVFALISFTLSLAIPANAFDPKAATQQAECLLGCGGNPKCLRVCEGAVAAHKAKTPTRNPPIRNPTPPTPPLPRKVWCPSKGAQVSEGACPTCPNGSEPRGAAGAETCQVWSPWLQAWLDPNDSRAPGACPEGSVPRGDPATASCACQDGTTLAHPATECPPDRLQLLETKIEELESRLQAEEAKAAIDTPTLWSARLGWLIPLLAFLLAILWWRKKGREKMEASVGKRLSGLFVTNEEMTKLREIDGALRDAVSASEFAAQMEAELTKAEADKAKAEADVEVAEEARDNASDPAAQAQAQAAFDTAQDALAGAVKRIEAFGPLVEKARQRAEEEDQKAADLTKEGEQDTPS